VSGLIRPPQTIGDVLEDIPMESKRWKSFDYLADKEKRDIAAGKGFKRQLLTGIEPHCGTVGLGYAKCCSTEPYVVNPLNSSLSRIFTRVRTVCPAAQYT